MMSTELVSLLFIAVAYIIGSIFYPMLTGGAGYTPTPRKFVAEALEMIDLKRDEVFYDLGCGTGEALMEASKVSDNVRGVEIEPVRWLIAKLRARGAEVRFGDLFRQDISDADVVFIFHYKGRINDRIARRIQNETRRGTRVISYGHPIEGMDLIESRGEIFIYKT